jgi:hypothetical protein
MEWLAGPNSRLGRNLPAPERQGIPLGLSPLGSAEHHVDAVPAKSQSEVESGARGHRLSSRQEKFWLPVNVLE